MMKLKRAYIMAGGKSRRMGKDKLFLPVDGEQLLQRTITVCQNSFDEVYIVAKEKAKFKQLETEVLIDAKEAEGPLAGLITALRHCSEPTCFVTAADFRDLDKTIIDKLIAKYSGEQYLGIHESNHLQPLCGIYDVSSLPALLKAADRGEYQLHKIISGLKSATVNLKLDQWRNVNHPADLID